MNAQDTAAASGSRQKRYALLGVLLGAALGLFAAMLPWARLELGSETEPLNASAAHASPATLALSLAGLAGFGALWILGRWARILLGMLLAAFGVIGAISAASFKAEAALRAVGATELRVDSATVAAALEANQQQLTAAPVIAIIGGVVLALAGLAVTATGSRWPATGRKYAAPASRETKPVADDRSANGRVDQWDLLTAGEDPTLDADEVDPLAGRDDGDRPTPGENSQ